MHNNFFSRPRRGAYSVKEMFNLPPRVLLYYEGDDDMRDTMVGLLKEKLENLDIEYTTELEDIQSVQMSIVFINKSFARNCCRDLDIFVNQCRRVSMWSTAVWYEEYDNHPKSLLVRHMLGLRFAYPNLSADPNEEEVHDEETKRKYRYSRNRLNDFIGRINTDEEFFVRTWGDIGKQMECVSDLVAKCLNPFKLDFSRIGDDLKAHIIDKGFKLFDDVVTHPHRSSLVATLEGCANKCCQLDIISKLLFTLVNQRAATLFRYSLYLSLSQQQQPIVPPGRRSLYRHFVHVMKSEHGIDSDLKSIAKDYTFFVVIDGLQDFKSKRQARTLQSFVRKLGNGSLVIATCTESIMPAICPLNIEIDQVQGFECTLQWPGTTKRPAYFSTLNSALHGCTTTSFTNPEDDSYSDDDMDADVDKSKENAPKKANRTTASFTHPEDDDDDDMGAGVDESEKCTYEAEGSSC